MSSKRRKRPVRTCIGCRETGEKRQLWRLVRTPEGRVKVDPTGKRPGRGAYVCPSAQCLEKALSDRRLEAALRVPISPEACQRLKDELSRELEGSGL